MIGRFKPSLVFRRFTAIFHAPAWLELCDFFSVPHGSESILPCFGAVMMLGGRQSGETFRSALPEPILNVDMLIVTFKFLPCLTAHEKHPSLIYREIWGFGHDSLKSLQFVHGDSPSCIVSTRYFCWWWRRFRRGDFLRNGIDYSGTVWYNNEVTTGAWLEYWKEE